MQHTISVLVVNQFGVLSRISGLFSGRGFNIESLNVAETYEDCISRMTIVTLGDREQAQAPKHTYNYGLKYKYPFGITLRCEVSGKDEFYFSDSHNMKSEKYQILNISLRYDYGSFSIVGWR